MRRTGGCALLNQPHCVVSRVAGRRCSLPLAPLATATACAATLCGTSASQPAATSEATDAANLRENVTAVLPSTRIPASISRADLLPTPLRASPAQKRSEGYGEIWHRACKMSRPQPVSAHHPQRPHYVVLRERNACLRSQTRWSSAAPSPAPSIRPRCP